MSSAASSSAKRRSRRSFEESDGGRDSEERGDSLERSNSQKKRRLRRRQMAKRKTRSGREESGKDGTRRRASKSPMSKKGKSSSKGRRKPKSTILTSPDTVRNGHLSPAFAGVEMTDSKSSDDPGPAESSMSESEAMHTPLARVDCGNPTVASPLLIASQLSHDDEKRAEPERREEMLSPRSELSERSTVRLMDSRSEGSCATMVRVRTMSQGSLGDGISPILKPSASRMTHESDADSTPASTVTSVNEESDVKLIASMLQNSLKVKVGGALDFLVSRLSDELVVWMKDSVDVLKSELHSARNQLVSANRLNNFLNESLKLANLKEQSLVSEIKELKREITSLKEDVASEKRRRVEAEVSSASAQSASFAAALSGSPVKLPSMAPLTGDVRRKAALTPGNESLPAFFTVASSDDASPTISSTSAKSADAMGSSSLLSVASKKSEFGTGSSVIPPSSSSPRPHHGRALSELSGLGKMTALAAGAGGFAEGDSSEEDDEESEASAVTSCSSVGQPPLSSTLSAPFGSFQMQNGTSSLVSSSFTGADRKVSRLSRQIKEKDFTIRRLNKRLDTLQQKFDILERECKLNTSQRKALANDCKRLESELSRTKRMRTKSDPLGGAYLSSAMLSQSDENTTSVDDFASVVMVESLSEALSRVSIGVPSSKPSRSSSLLSDPVTPHCTPTAASPISSAQDLSQAALKSGYDLDLIDDDVIDSTPAPEMSGVKRRSAVLELAMADTKDSELDLNVGGSTQSVTSGRHVSFDTAVVTNDEGFIKDETSESED